MRQYNFTLSDESRFNHAGFDKPLVLSHTPGDQDISRIQSHAGCNVYYNHKGEKDNVDHADSFGFNSDPLSVYGRMTAGRIKDGALSIDFDWDDKHPQMEFVRNQVDSGILKGSSIGARFTKRNCVDMGDHYRVRGWELIGGSLTPVPELTSVGLSADKNIDLKDDEYVIIGLNANIGSEDHDKDNVLITNEQIIELIKVNRESIVNAFVK